MIVTICYFLQSIKSVFIVVQCNTSPSKNYVAHVCNNCSLCDRLNLRKNRFVCTPWLSVNMKSVAERGFFYEFTFDNKALKTFVKFSIFTSLTYC